MRKRTFLDCFPLGLIVKMSWSIVYIWTFQLSFELSTWESILITKLSVKKKSLPQRTYILVKKMLYVYLSLSSDKLNNPLNLYYFYSEEIYWIKAFQVSEKTFLSLLFLLISHLRSPPLPGAVSVICVWWPHIIPANGIFYFWKSSSKKRHPNVPYDTEDQHSYGKDISDCLILRGTAKSSLTLSCIQVIEKLSQQLLTHSAISAEITVLYYSGHHYLNYFCSLLRL